MRSRARPPCPSEGTAAQQTIALAGLFSPSMYFGHVRCAGCVWVSDLMDGMGWDGMRVCGLWNVRVRNKEHKQVCVCVRGFEERKFIIFSMTPPPTTDSSLPVSLVSCVDDLSPTTSCVEGHGQPPFGEPIQFKKKNKEDRTILSLLRSFIQKPYKAPAGLCLSSLLSSTHPELS